MTESIDSRDIAIIGMSGRFPQARNLAAFWDNLQHGREAVSFFSDQELRAAGVPDDVLRRPDYIKAGLVLDGIEEFDAAFFGYHPREAEIMDPQQRLFLEHAWEAMEDAGCVPQRFEGLIGVYAGVAWNTYLLSNLSSHPELFDGPGAFQVFITNDKDFMPTRVSYKLNLKGPSMIIQTSCSTSLVAVHLARLSLLNYECDLALAGGVTAKVPQQAGYFYQDGGLASPDGHCRAFDADAQGTIFGSGVGVIALKRLQDAIDDGDTIHAVIKGSAINNDGALKVSYTAPSVDGQAEVVAIAQSLADVAPESISYIEAHGTGTALGDPIEIAALSKVFGGTAPRHSCAIGSVKTNIGHLDAAAGIAGLLKTVLALKHRQIPPSLNYRQPNPKIDFDNSPFYVNAELSEWRDHGQPRRAGVSSFGVGGTNAHVILEEAPEVVSSPSARAAHILVLSARSDSALEQAVRLLIDRLKQPMPPALADVAYTLQLGRTDFSHRRMVVCTSVEDAISALEADDPRRVFSATQATRARPVAFLFSGQGAQYVGMGRDLYAQEPVFRATVDQCCALLVPHLGCDLRAVLYPAADQDAATNQLTSTALAQPALFVIEYALALLWQSWGVVPQALLGHSIGEYVAATLAGVFTLEDALRLVALRGRLMQALPGGAMISVSLSEHELRPLLGPDCAIAAVNGVQQCVASGPHTAIEALEQTLGARGVSTRRLHTSHAFHSPMLDPIQAPFLAELRRVTLQPPTRPYLSNLTGDWISAADATDPAYWVRHLREPVRFADGLARLATDPEYILLEVGPGQSLSTLARHHPLLTDQHAVLSSLRRPDEQHSDTISALTALGRLWLAGLPLDWSTLYGSDQRRLRVPLPTYPFERQRFWIEPVTAAAPAPALAATSKSSDSARWCYLPTWQRTMPLAQVVRERLAAQPQHWLIFADPHGIGAGLAETLTGAGHTVVLVRPAASWEEVAPGSYTLDPQQRDDYDRLAQALHAAGQFPERVLHLWSIPAQPADQLNVARFDAVQQLGFLSLLRLVQALERVGQAAPLDIVVVSHLLHAVSGAEQTDPHQAPILGLCRVLPQEYVQLSCRSIDLAIQPEPLARARLVEYVLAEALAVDAEPVVAYRDLRRWVQHFTPLEQPSAPASPTIRPGGTYLLTGGLESIGGLIADHLARTAQARLALLEDPDFPAPEQWQDWLSSHEPQHPISRKIRRCLALQEHGAETLVLSAALDDPEQVCGALDRAQQHFGSLHGVVHAAGVFDERSFRAVQETDAESSAWHFRPKVHLTIALAQALQDRTLDFCLLASSLASVLGGRGYAAYTAANLFLDSFAQRWRAQSTTPWISVNWDAWHDDDNQAQLTRISGDLATLAIQPHEIGALVQQVLAVPAIEQVVVSTTDLGQRIQQWRQRSAAERSQKQRDEQRRARHPRPKLQTMYVMPTSELEHTIAEVWQQVLGFEQIGTHDNFFDLGGDSLIAMRLMARLKETLRLDLPVVMLYQGLTVATLAQIIERERATAQDQHEVHEERQERMSQRRQFQNMRRSTKHK